MVSAVIAQDNPLHREAARDDARRTKEATLATLEERRHWWILQGRFILVTVALERGQASSDDIHERLTLPDEIDPTCLGSVPTMLARAGIIKRIGYIPTSRKTAKSRPLSLWEIADREAAQRYLAQHSAQQSVGVASIEQIELTEPVQVAKDVNQIAIDRPALISRPTVQGSLFDEETC